MQVTRLTGSYYTSQRIADYMAAWALRDRSDTLLEPAFGDGVFLDAAFNRFSALGNDTPTVIGVELQPAVFSKYADSAPTSFAGCCKDFMECSEKIAVSAVVGNPPYVRLRNLKEEDRARAIDRMADYKIKMLSSGSLWMPFTIHASMLMCGKVTNDNLIDSSHYFRNTDQYEKLMWGFSYISFCLSKHFGESDVFVSFLLTASL